MFTANADFMLEPVMAEVYEATGKAAYKVSADSVHMWVVRVLS